jgi:hypothetical protein
MTKNHLPQADSVGVTWLNKLASKLPTHATMPGVAAADVSHSESGMRAGGDDIRPVAGGLVRMRRAFALAPLLALAASCGGDSLKYASAASTAGMAVAAAGAYRATTGGCWAMCAQGEQCDESTGACVALPCRGACPADQRCATIEGKETCVRGLGRDVATREPPEAELDGGAPESATEDVGAPARDRCRGPYMRDERCVLRGGVADCVPAGDTGAP